LQTELTVEGMDSAERMIGELEEKYGSLGVAVDRTSGKIVTLTEAASRVRNIELGVSDGGDLEKLTRLRTLSMQAKLDVMSVPAMRREIGRGMEILTGILGAAAATSAAPGWRTNSRLLRVKAEFPFAYNSDCRGFAPFYPVVDGERLSQLQIPVTLPTYDEALGRDGVSDANYNEFQLSLLQPDRLNVLTIHAEAEGGRCAAQFDRYLAEVIRRGYRVVTLGEIAAEVRDSAPDGIMRLAPFPGREGLLAVQQR